MSTTTLELDGGTQLPLTVRRHPRARRLTLRLTPDGTAATLTVPSRVSEREGVAFARAQRDWLATRVAALTPAVPFAPGAVLPVCDREVTLAHDPARRQRVERVADRLVVGGDPALMPGRVRRWLLAEARRVLTEQATVEAARVDRVPAAVAIRDPASRWGSCSSRGRLNFSWRLILAPAWVRAYVVRHEVAHLVEPNHGPGFWALVARLHGDPAPAQAWLRQHGRRLHRYGP